MKLKNIKYQIDKKIYYKIKLRYLYNKDKRQKKKRIKDIENLQKQHNNLNNYCQ